MSRRSKQKHDRRTLRQKISLRKILRFLFSRMVIVGVLIFLQLAFLVALLVVLLMLTFIWPLTTFIL